MLEELFNFLFPKKCLLCGEISSEDICRNCRKDFALLSAPLCEICGAPVSESLQICSHCLKEKPPFTLCRSALPYKGLVREAVLRYKFKGEAFFTSFLGNYLLDYMKSIHYEMDSQMIVPVPGSNDSLKRKIDAAGFLSLFLKENLCIDLVGALYAKRVIKPQHSLKLKERWENVRGVFSVKPQAAVAGKKILLIDDIYTTGATVSDCSRALLEGSAEEVKVLTLCRALFNEGEFLE